MAEKWEMTKRIVRMCHMHNGTIFGGCARDSYIHDYDAHKFYQKYQVDQYQDTQITEFSGRFVVPNDIDCLILAKDHELLLKMLQLRFHIHIMLDLNANYLPSFNLTPEDSYQFIRYSIVELARPTIVVQLDMIIQRQGDEIIFPFGVVDMDVNTLLWTKDSMHINPNALRVLDSSYGNGIARTSLGKSIIQTIVFEHLMARKAQCNSECSSRRILKMKNRGWDVHYSYEAIRISNAPYDGVCVLCQDTIVGYHSTFECKCAHICMDCLRKHYRSLHKCTICKTPVEFDSLKNDVRIYTALHMDLDEDLRYT